MTYNPSFLMLDKQKLEFVVGRGAELQPKIQAEEYIIFKGDMPKVAGEFMDAYEK